MHLMKIIYGKAVLVSCMMGILFLCISCIPTNLGEEDDFAVSTYARFTLRSQGSGPSINQDFQNWEDWVKTVAFLIIPTGEMERQGFIYTGHTGKSPAIKVPAGKNDIYIFANVPVFEVDGLLLRSQVEEYMKRKTEFRDWHGVSNATPDAYGFRMSRVYYNQYIPAMHPQSAPYEWIPEATSAVKPLYPVSSYGTDPVSGIQVGLVRSCAKITLAFTGPGIDNIKRVSYHAAAKNTTLKQLPEGSLVEEALGQEFVIKSDPTMPSKKKAVLYVPERIASSMTLTPAWNTVSDLGENGINYVMIELNSGRKYTFPIINNGTAAISKAIAETGKKFLDLAKGGDPNFVPDYSVVRNFHYHHNIYLPAENKEVEIALMVLPWSRIESEMSYARPRYEVRIYRGIEGEGSGITGEYFKDINEEIVLPDNSNRQPTGVTIKVKISAPIGALWTASITNGREFELTGDVNGTIGVDGIVAGVDEWHTMTLKPRVPFEAEPRYTHFFITVEGKELFLGFKDDGLGNMIPDNRFIGDGSAIQWQFKQERRLLTGI